MVTPVKPTAFVFASVILGMQFVRPAHTNPPTDNALTLEAIADVPASVSRTFALACNDCHSHKTNWRWYTYVAPISWLTVSHVNNGRAELNFSMWGTYSARMRQTRLRAICELSRSGSMPLPSYALMHPRATLSPEQIAPLCEWTESLSSSGVIMR